MSVRRILLFYIVNIAVNYGYFLTGQLKQYSIER